MPEVELELRRLKRELGDVLLETEILERMLQENRDEAEQLKRKASDLQACVEKQA